jgi:poly-gamma-glutamate synthesis protein (capsule biosynthesis protein)
VILLRKKYSPGLARNPCFWASGLRFIQKPGLPPQNAVFLALSLSFILFSSCRNGPVWVYLDIKADDASRPQGAVLESLLEDGQMLLPLGIRLVSPDEPGDPKPDMVLELAASWEFEGTPEGPVLSRTYFVPREDALAGRRNTSLEACLAGEETLVPLGELAPPFIALRVDNLTIKDRGYPLIRTTGFRIRGTEETLAGEDQIALLAEALRAALSAALEEAPEEAPESSGEEGPELLWIAAAGDLMLGRGAGDILFREGPEGLYGGAARLFQEADLRVLNLEGAISRRGTRAEKAYNFRFPPEAAGALGAAGIQAVLLANNHVFDWGAEAFLDTLMYLEEASVYPLGAGRNEEEAVAPLVFTKGSSAVHAFGIASFPREASGWDGLSAAAGPDRAGLLHWRQGGGEKLRALFSDEALDVVFFHGGQEWTNRPDPPTREFYTELIRAGADLLIGSHPHFVQGFEWVLGKPAFWSLGNFVFAGMENTGGGDQGLFIRLGFWGNRLLYLEPYPLDLSGPRTDLASPEKLARFYALSGEL